MGVVDTDGRLNSYAAWLIRKKARSLIGKYGFTNSDKEDIEQELWLHLLRRQDCYDPARSRVTTFIARVVENRIRTLIEHQRAGKRSCDTPVDSLDDRVSPDIEMDRHEVVDQETYLRATGQISQPLAELRELALDVDRAISSLPPDLRDIALLLMQYTITEVSRRTGIPRTTINDKRDQIRRAFEKHGLEVYT